jgi:hypothetical protein
LLFIAFEIIRYRGNWNIMFSWFACFFSGA